MHGEANRPATLKLNQIEAQRVASRLFPASVALSLLLTSPVAWAQSSAISIAPQTGILGAPLPLDGAAILGHDAATAHLHPERPHPAVARIVVPEGDATSYGSGTLIDVRDQYGLVVTNWHVVRDGHGEVEVIFPDGFRSKARPLKVDSDWDLAALVIWRPSVAPVTLAAVAPRPGDWLTICGYGSGQYRAATGRCTQYYSPAVDLPQHMVELDVEARQGDSGGPIFNDRGELAGVLFGAGQGTTLGSFGGQVGSFLATLAPNIGGVSAALAHDAAPDPHGPTGTCPANPSALLAAASDADQQKRGATFDGHAREHVSRYASNPSASNEVESAASLWTEVDGGGESIDSGWRAAATASPTSLATLAPAATPLGWTGHSKNALAVIGAAALLLQLLRAVR